MRLTFLGKDSQGGQSPTLYATDRDTYVVQGWRVPSDPAAVEIPPGLLRFVQPGTTIATTGTDSGTYVVTGLPVTDAEALSLMDMPEHETCVEVGRVAV
jgi:hypothetical protein